VNRIWGRASTSLGSPYTNIGRLPISMKTHQELARHCEPSLTMRYTHTQIDDKVKALDALPPANPEQDAEKSAVA